MWFQIVQRSGNRSVAEAKKNVSATEFLRWVRLLEQEHNDFHREDWLFAQVCFEVYRLYWYVRHMFQKEVPEVDRTLESFVLKFEVRKAAADAKPTPETTAAHAEPAAAEQVDPETVKAARDRRLALSKAYWFGITGLADKTGKLKVRTPPSNRRLLERKTSGNREAGGPAGGGREPV